MPAADTYFITWKGRRDGPYSLAQLEKLLNDGEIGLLHRVETPTGSMSLRQLVEAAHPLLPTPPASSAANAPSSESAAPRMAAPAGHISEQEIFQLYVKCGLCFAFPPLAWWTWNLSQGLAAKGHAATANKIKWLGVGLGAGGLVMWALLWRMW